MGKVVAGSFEEIVKIILRRVRTGIPLHQTGTQPSVEELIEEARKRENSSTEILRLKLLCLESEYHGQNGRYSEAAKCLETSWQSIWPSSETTLPQSLSENGDRVLLRQKLWLALHYVNYKFAVNRNTASVALAYFASIEEGIDRFLAHPPEYEPYGTRAILYLYRGACLRSSGQFAKAEKEFLRAKESTIERTKKELTREQTRAADKKGSPQNMASPAVYLALDFRDVFTARISAAQSWVSIQRGRLLPAQHMLTTAKGLLISTNHDAISLLIRSLLAFCNRRRSMHDEPQYWNAMTELQHCFEAFNGNRDFSGQNRCCAELIYGYLDAAQFAERSEERKGYLKLAKDWLAKLKELNDTRRKAEGPLPTASIVRRHLLTARYHSINRPADKRVDAELSAARIALAADKDDDGKDKRDSQWHTFSFGINLMSAQIHIDLDRAESALTLLRETLQKLELLQASDPHPVAEAHTYLLMAMAYSRQGSVDPFRQFFKRWQSLGQFVENTYLHALARKIEFRGQAETFLVTSGEILRPKEGVPVSLKTRMKDYEDWVIETVIREKTDLSVSQIATFLGVSEATVWRRKRETKARATNK
jgi:tetratricopeptide (TPR) repeat protein